MAKPTRSSKSPRLRTPPASDSVAPVETGSAPAVPAAPRPASEDPRRTQLLAAASAVLHDKGYGAMTTLDVARAAGMSKRDLYRWFPSKDHLITALIEDAVTAMVQPIVLGQPTTREAFYAALQQFARVFLTDMTSPDRLEFYRIAITEAPRSPHIGRTLNDAGAGGTTALLKAFIERAQLLGLCRFPSVDAALGVFFYVVIGDRMMTALLDPTRQLTDADIERAIGLTLLALRALDAIKDATDSAPGGLSSKAG